MCSTAPTAGRAAPFSRCCLDPKKEEELNWKLARKYEIITQSEVDFENYLTDDAKLVVVAYGTAARIAKGAVNRLRELGLKVGMFRPKSLWPFPLETAEGPCTLGGKPGGL